MHTPIEFYVKLPADLFRGGTTTKHEFDYKNYLDLMKQKTDSEQVEKNMLGACGRSNQCLGISPVTRGLTN